MADQQAAVDVGSFAPSVRLRTEQGDDVELAYFWREQPVVLAFVRHFG